MYIQSWLHLKLCQKAIHNIIFYGHLLFEDITLNRLIISDIYIIISNYILLNLLVVSYFIVCLNKSVIKSNLNVYVLTMNWNRNNCIIKKLI